MASFFLDPHPHSDSKVRAVVVKVGPSRQTILQKLEIRTNPTNRVFKNHLGGLGVWKVRGKIIRVDLAEF